MSQWPIYLREKFPVRPLSNFRPTDGGKATKVVYNLPIHPKEEEETKHPGSSCVKMAASMLCKRTAALCRTLKGLSSSKAVLSVNSQCGSLLQTACYNPKPLKLNIRDPYIPDKDSEKTPEWQKTPRHDRKLFGRYGSVSGIDPSSLWPSHEELDKIIAEENDWHPPLDVMLKNIEAKENEETEKRLAK